MAGLSVILRGTIDDRLNWAFNLYDLNKDGCITKEVRRATEEWEGGGKGPQEGNEIHVCIPSKGDACPGPWASWLGGCGL